MWLEIDKKAEAFMQAAESRIRSSETAKAEQEPPWDGEALLLCMCVLQDFCMLQPPAAAAAAGIVAQGDLYCMSGCCPVAAEYNVAADTAHALSSQCMLRKYLSTCPASACVELRV